MSQLRKTATNSILTIREDMNGIQVPSSSRAVGHSDLLYTFSGWDHEISKSSRNLLFRQGPYAQLNEINRKQSISESMGQPISKQSIQNMSHVSTQTIDLESGLHNKCSTRKVENKIVRPPIYNETFSPQMWPSQTQMQLRKFENVGSKIFGHNSPRIPLQDTVCQDPISTALPFDRTMDQSGIYRGFYSGTGVPVSTTAVPARRSSMNKIRHIWSLGAREKPSHNPSFVNDLTTPRSKFSNIINTPIPCCISPTGCDINCPRNIDNPLLLYTPPSRFTPTQVNSCLPSEPASMDLPPTLELYNQNPKCFSYPSVASCNIHLAPASSVPDSYALSKLNNTNSDANFKTTPRRRISRPFLTPLRKSNDQVGDGTRAKKGFNKNIWDNSCEFLEWKNEGSNLYITWAGLKVHLLAELCRWNLFVIYCLTTRNANIFNVVFLDHLNARRAFLSQRDIRVRMVPPKNSTRNWFKSPSPRFLVKYETKFRLTIRSGKASSHEIVGEFLMSNFKKKKGCCIWVDQLKGHRIRVVGCEGNLKLPSGVVIYLKSPPRKDGMNITIGWVSYRNKYTREDLVIRRSGNILREYIYES